jgi:ATP-binding cassette subfamily B protein/subfamily B ATP-binding cassette protein MsbA
MPPPTNFLTRLLRLLQGHRLMMAISVTFGLLFAGTTLIPPLLIRRLIIWLTEGGGSAQSLVLMSLALFGVYLFRGLCRYGYGRYSHVVAYRVLDELLVKVYRHLQGLSHRFYNKQRTGDLIARSINDIEFIEDFIAHGIPDTVLAFIIPATMVAVLCTINWPLALIVVLPLPIAAFFIYRFTRPIRAMWRQVRGGAAGLIAQVQDSLAGMREIKSFGREAEMAEAVRLHSARYREASIRANNLSLAPAGLIELAGGMGIILAVWLGGGFALAGQMSVADLFVFVVYLGYIYQPFLTLANLTDVLSKAASSLERVFELLDVEPDIVSPPNAVTLPRAKGNITFRDVTFGYEPDRPVLHNINFHVEAGQMVALVGATGAGKTTLIGLVQRFYDPLQGAIFVDGHDMRSLDLHSLRRNIAAVHQDIFLFHGTVRQNILFGRPDAGEAEMVAAARAANADEFIDHMPDGYDTLIGERGARLSGGQKQRLSIARALLKDAPVLLLDEATSSVDGETEWLIQQALSRLTVHRTTLVIAHRLSTIAHADRIIVLDGGRIVETGAHAELLARNSHYARMVQMQDLARQWQFGDRELQPER